MFPLGSVLFPQMPLQLRVFEERYLMMLSDLLKADTSEFGVVLIECGQEVGGGEHRFGVGTVAEILQLGSHQGDVILVAQGGRRFVVEAWLDDAPHPQADVTDLPDLSWDPELQSQLDYANTIVRRALTIRSEFTEGQWSPDVEVSEDPLAASWQLAGIAPIGPLDQLALLRSESAEALLSRVIEFTEEAMADINTPWPEET